MKAALQHIAFPDIAYAIGWHKEQFADELVSEHMLFHILSGEMQLRDVSGERMYRAGETVLVKRNHLVKCESHPLRVGTPHEVIVFILDKELLQDYAIKNHFHKTTEGVDAQGVISLEAKPSLMSLFESLMPYFKSSTLLTSVMKRHKLEEAILALLEQDNNLSEWLFNFNDPGKIDLREFMLRNYMFNIPVGKFAELTGRSVSTFQRDFFKIFGSKASHWLLKQRLQAAYDALSTGKRKPSDIYLETGFGDLSHFSKVFKKAYGYSPSAIVKNKKSIQELLKSEK